MRVLILGHKGMLGSEVMLYFSNTPFETLVTDSRWGESDFASKIDSLHPDYIVNCIGKIPQKNPDENEYKSTNIDLPIFLDSLSIPVVHPSTDCEFSGQLPHGELYTKQSIRDAEDTYGKSKAIASEWIENKRKNTKIIRTSIIGHEQKTSVSLLDWFLSQTGTVNGFTNHYWNGITTLEWTRQCEYLIQNWDTEPILTQLGTQKCMSKYEVLSTIKDVYKKDIDISPFETETTINKYLLSDRKMPSLKEQLQELRFVHNR